MRYRRLARDYKRTAANAEAMIYWTTVLIMTRRLARYESGQPRSGAGAVNDPAPPGNCLTCRIRGRSLVR